jgi:peptidoglycan/xylan/chitin deacetylase (PgdA/CDA1 family)
VNGVVARLGAPVALVLGFGLRLSTRRLGAVLVYHRVGDPPGDWRRELLPALGTGLFEAQLRHLRRAFRVVPVSEIVEAAARRRRGQALPVAVTFDDDLGSHAAVAAPILERLGLRATFFLPGASLDTPFAFWWERLQLASDQGWPIEDLVPAGSGRSESRSRVHHVAASIERLPARQKEAVMERLREWVPDVENAGISRAEVAALAGAGHEIGFHTLSHDRLPTLEDSALAAAMTGGRKALAAAAGRVLDLIAYPHGAADSRVAEAAAAAGYRLGFTTEEVPVTPWSNPLLIGRISPSHESLGQFALKLIGVLRAPR